MTEFTITDGTVEYRHTKPRAEYESVVPAVKLNFQVAEGSDPETVTWKVMGMAREVVEGTLIGQIKPLPSVAGTLKEQLPPATRSRKAGSAPAPVDPPTVVAETSAVADAGSPITEKELDTGPSDDALAALAGEGVRVVSPEDDLAALSGEQPAQLTSDDVQKVLMKASAHLRKEFGHINDIKKLLTSFNVGGWGSLKPEQYAGFVDKASALCDLKKGS